MSVNACTSYCNWAQRAAQALFVSVFNVAPMLDMPVDKTHLIALGCLGFATSSITDFLLSDNPNAAVIEVLEPLSKSPRFARFFCSVAVPITITLGPALLGTAALVNLRRTPLAATYLITTAALSGLYVGGIALLQKHRIKSLFCGTKVKND